MSLTNLGQAAGIVCANVGRQLAHTLPPGCDMAVVPLARTGRVRDITPHVNFHMAAYFAIGVHGHVLCIQSAIFAWIGI